MLSVNEFVTSKNLYTCVTLLPPLLQGGVPEHKPSLKPLLDEETSRQLNEKLAELARDIEILVPETDME